MLRHGDQCKFPLGSIDILSISVLLSVSAVIKSLSRSRRAGIWMVDQIGVYWLVLSLYFDLSSTFALDTS